MDPLFKRYIENYAIGEIDKPKIKDTVVTIDGFTLPINQCYKVVRDGVVIGWGRL